MTITMSPGVNARIDRLGQDLTAARQRRDEIDRQIAELYGLEALDGRSRAKERAALEAEFSRVERDLQSLERAFVSTAAIRRSAERSAASAQMEEASARRAARHGEYSEALATSVRSLNAAVRDAQALSAIAADDRQDFYLVQRAAEATESIINVPPILPAIVDPDVMARELRAVANSARHVFPGLGLKLPAGLPEE